MLPSVRLDYGGMLGSYHGMSNNKHGHVAELAFDAGDMTFHILTILVDAVDVRSLSARSTKTRYETK